MNSPLVRKLGFSLVELVIVVVIIGIIAAIAVPRISRGAKGASEAAVRSNLHALRTAIDLYAAEHHGAWAGSDGLKGTFKKQLTDKSAPDGRITGLAAGRTLGPYIRNIPRVAVGPNPDAFDIEMTTTTPIQSAVTESPMQGWIYNYETGDIIANTDDLDESGVGYDTY